MMATKEKVLQLLKDSSEFLSGEKKLPNNYKFPVRGIWKAIKRIRKSRLSI